MDEHNRQQLRQSDNNSSDDPIGKPNENVLLLFTYHVDRGRSCRDHMVVGFTTTYAISAYHH